MDQLYYAPLGETVYHCVLPNGLNIYVDDRPEYEKQFAFFAVNYGGMDGKLMGEDGRWIKTPAGVAHFLEHKMFDTEDGSALQIMAANGASDNAFTAASITGYYFECTRGFEENLRTLLSFVSVPYFTQENVAKEQGIIGQEIRMCEDDPDSEVYYQMMGALYQNHPVKTKIVGTVNSIAEITPEMLHQCHSTFYRPGNMVLCVAGPVDAEVVKTIAMEVVPGSGASSVERDLGGKEPDEPAAHYVEREMPVSVPLFEIGIKGSPAQPGQGLRQQLVAELVCDVLFGPSAPLYSHLYEQGLINSTFDSGYESVPGCACLMAGGESRDPKRVLEEVLKEAERLSREGIDGSLWERLKKAAYGSMVRRLNSLETVCIELAQGHFDGEDYLRFPEVFQSIERSDGEALLRSWCTRERAALSVIRPKRSFIEKNEES